MFDHVTIRVSDRDASERFAPAERPEYYSACVLDPDGNNVEAVSRFRG